MYELRISGRVLDRDLDQALAIFQGLCAMTAEPIYQRILFFDSSPAPPGLPTVRRLPAAHPQKRYWMELDSHLSRTRYSFQLHFDVSRELDFGAAE